PGEPQASPTPTGPTGCRPLAMLRGAGHQRAVRGPLAGCGRTPDSRFSWRGWRSGCTRAAAPQGARCCVSVAGAQAGVSERRGRLCAVECGDADEVVGGAGEEEPGPVALS